MLRMEDITKMDITYYGEVVNKVVEEVRTHHMDRGEAVEETKATMHNPTNLKNKRHTTLLNP